MSCGHTFEAQAVSDGGVRLPALPAMLRPEALKTFVVHGKDVCDVGPSLDAAVVGQPHRASLAASVPQLNRLAPRQDQAQPILLGHHDAVADPRPSQAEAAGLRINSQEYSSCFSRSAPASGKSSWAVGLEAWPGQGALPGRLQGRSPPRALFSIRILNSEFEAESLSHAAQSAVLLVRVKQNSQTSQRLRDSWGKRSSFASSLKP